MKNFSLKELTEKAAPIFKKLGVNKLFATTDGQFFILESRARLHAAKSLKVYQIDAAPTTSETKAGNGANEPDTDGEVKEGKKEAAAISVSTLTELVNQSTDIKALHQLLEVEISGQNRKTAIKAIEARIATLTEKPKE